VGAPRQPLELTVCQQCDQLVAVSPKAGWCWPCYNQHVFRRYRLMIRGLAAMVFVLGCVAVGLALALFVRMVRS